MQSEAIDFEHYDLLQDEVCAQRIIEAKKLGKRGHFGTPLSTCGCLPARRFDGRLFKALFFSGTN